MSRCAHKPCARWRPTILVKTAGLGLYLDDAWYCSTQCLGSAVRDRLAHAAPVAATPAPSPRQPRLGGLLAIQKRLPAEVLEAAASAQARTGLRIGSQLVELGAVTKLDVLRALASQNCVGFLTALDPSRVVAAPGDLSPAVVRALGVVPFESDRRHDVLKVACTAPIRRSALAALRELTGSIIEPYLVADDLWPALVSAYGASKRGQAPEPATVTDLESLADRVAQAARHARAVRMSEARCDDSLWVRLDSGNQVQELLLMAPRNDDATRPLPAEAAVRPPRPRRARAPRPAGPHPRTRRPRTVPAPAPVHTRLEEPVPALAQEAPAVDLSFLEAWDSKSVPLFEQ